MQNNNDQEPVELQEDFLKSVDDAARQDEERTLEYVSHEVLMAKLDKVFSSIEDDIMKFESENPDYADVNMPRLE